MTPREALMLVHIRTVTIRFADEEALRLWQAKFNMVRARAEKNAWRTWERNGGPPPTFPWEGVETWKRELTLHVGVPTLQDQGIVEVTT